MTTAVKKFAMRMADSKPSQASCIRTQSHLLHERPWPAQQPPAHQFTACTRPPVTHACCLLQVFVPKEELSLDVIKQYRVVRPLIELPCAESLAVSGRACPTAWFRHGHMHAHATQS